MDPGSRPLSKLKSVGHLEIFVGYERKTLKEVGYPSYYPEFHVQ